MKTIETMERFEQVQVAELFEAWLKCYTHEVIVHVMSKVNEIINNEFAMKLLIELKSRQEDEEKEMMDDFLHLVTDFETFKEFDIHNRPLTHSSSYRDILYDMYIR